MSSHTHICMACTYTHAPVLRELPPSHDHGKERGATPPPPERPHELLAHTAHNLLLDDVQVPRAERKLLVDLSVLGACLVRAWCVHSMCVV